MTTPLASVGSEVEPSVATFGMSSENLTVRLVIGLLYWSFSLKETFDEISQPLPARQILSGEAETNSSDCAIGAATTRSTCFCWLVPESEALMRSVAAQPLSW